MDEKQLDFNAPLLSMKRHSYSLGEEICFKRDSKAVIGKLQDTSSRIPFSWEQAAGKPKDSEKSDSLAQDDDFNFTPRLRIPPGRLWQQQQQQHREREFTISYDETQFFHADEEFHQDSSCDADVDHDDYYDNKHGDEFSDAAEVLSLTEAMDIVEKAEKGNGLDGFNLESLGHDQSISPSYIIDRFLPDAAALAASSVLNVSENMKRNHNNNNNNHFHSHPQDCVPEAVRKSYSTADDKVGCGLEMLFPWRTKHRFCGVKSPVRQRGSADDVQFDDEYSARCRSRFH